MSDTTLRREALESFRVLSEEISEAYHAFKAGSLTPEVVAELGRRFEELEADLSHLELVDRG